MIENNEFIISSKKFKRKGAERATQEQRFEIPAYHNHDGVDQPRLNPKFFRGYPIYTAVPTHTAEEGTFVWASFGGFIYLYTMLNKVWHLMAISPAFNTTNDLTVNSIEIGGTDQVTGIITNTATLNFGAIGQNLAADLTMTLTGAADGDSVMLGVADGVISGGTNCADISFFAWVSATNTVKIRCVNASAVNTANPASGLFRVTIIKF